MLVTYIGTNGEVLVVAADDESTLLANWFGLEIGRITEDDVDEYFEDNPDSIRLPKGVEVYERREALAMVQIESRTPAVEVNNPFNI